MTQPVRLPALLAAFWGLFFLLSTLAVFSPKAIVEISIDRLLLTLLGLLGSLIIISVVQRAGDGAPGRALVIVTCMFLGAGWSAGHRLAMERARNLLHGDPIYRLGAKVLFHNTLFYGMVLVAWYLLLVGVRELGRAQAERERALAAEAEARRMELRALRYQLHPHFLFNTLNGVVTLVLEERTAEAAEALERLSRFLRSTLVGGEQEERSLAEELDALRDYLAIEQARLGDRLAVKIEADTTSLRRRVPTLLLQPLAENAIRHGIAPREGLGRMRIGAISTSGQTEIVIANDAPPSQPGVEGIGLTNVRARLAAWGGTEATMSVERDDEHWLVRLTLPAREGQ